MEKNSLAPVCLFVYKRLDTLEKTVASLQQNGLATQTHLHVFSDAPAKTTDEEGVARVRSFIRSIKGFASVNIYPATANKGLANSIIEGVTAIVNQYGSVIVLEDDLQVSTNFLHFMNEALVFYKKTAEVYSISGYSSPVNAFRGSEVYFTQRASPWGWATWQDRWKNIDWQVADFDHFISNKTLQRNFNKMGSDLTHMLNKQMNGRINSWAIRWVYHQFKYNLYTVFPVVSKVINNGFHPEASNTEKSDATRFSTHLDKSGQTTFRFQEEVVLKKEMIQQFLTPYTLTTRAFYRIKALLHL